MKHVCNINPVALTGAHAAAEAMKQINPDVVPVYPITPQTPIAEKFCYFKAEAQVDAEIVLAESEHSVMSIAVGAAAAGARVMTASSSQGLALMNEVLPVASGMRLPVVMCVVNRALSSPLNIHCDHSDSMNVKDTGWVQIFAENAQEAYDFTFIGLKLAESINLPVMVCQDGFITSHCVEQAYLLAGNEVNKYIGKQKERKTLLDTENPLTFGAWQLPNAYMETKIEQNKAVQSSLKHYINCAENYAKVSGRKYRLFEEYCMKDAEAVIVATSSAAGTVKAVVDRMRKNQKKVGLLKLHLFRPFPYKEVAKALANAKSAAVLDRAVAFGANAPLFAEVMQSLFSYTKKPRLQSCVFGLGGRDFYEEQAENVFNEMLAGKTGEVKYLC